MAAPPNVANADSEAQAFLNWAADDAGPPFVRAARSSKRLRVARELQAVNVITEAELGEHEGFHARCALHAGGGPAVEEAIDAVPGVPPWFGPAMAAALQPVQAQLNQLNIVVAQVNNIEVQVNNMQAQLNNVAARQANSVASDPMDPLHGLTNDAGVVFANFPDTLQALLLMNAVQMAAFLNHYGLAPGVSNELKLHRIKKFIGMKIA